MKEPKEYVIIGIVEELLNKNTYSSLDDLKKDAIAVLVGEGYTITPDIEKKVQKVVTEKGYTGRHRIDDIIGRKLRDKRYLTIVISISLFLTSAVFEEIILPIFAEDVGIVKQQKLTKEDAEKILEVEKEKELKEKYGEMRPTEILKSIVLDEEVLVNGDKTKAYVKLWKPWRDPKAPNKGWLTMENPYMRIDVNLDRPYYLLYDKINKKDILIYNDNVENVVDMLTGCDIGFADLDADNKVPFSTTAINDMDGIDYSCYRRMGF